MFAIVTALCIGVLFAPAAPFIIDGGIYYDMARAMADRSALFIAENGGVEGSPPLTKFLTIAIEGEVYPQYPSGYAYFAAPFYKLFGIRGLMLMNVLGLAASLWLTFAIARRLYDDHVARWATLLFALSTFAPTYAFGIWPHHLSLTFCLAAIYLALVGSDAGGSRQAFGFYLLTGMSVGIGVNIRVDLILTAVVLFFWMRLFANPNDRLGPLALFIGLAPGLLFASWLNWQKFGAFTPLSYGPSDGNDSLERYIPLILAIIATVAILWSLNVQKQITITFARQRKYWIFGALICSVAALTITPLGEFIWKVCTGIYVLVFNLQAHDAYHQTGVERNEYGHLLFWGYPKKALIQSIPWAPLIILPVYHFFHGKHVNAVSLCLLAIAATVTFYALSQWHGGGSYNMRYFLSALPFIAILSAWSLRELTTNAGPSRQTVLMAMVSAGAIYLGLQEIGQSNAQYLAPAALYPQWIIAALVLAATVLTLLRPFEERARFVASSVALFALCYGVAINLYEEFGHERTRAEQLARAEDISAPIQPEALVITASPLSFIPAEKRGSFVMAINEGNIEQVERAIRAFAHAGRCVYIHNAHARGLLSGIADPGLEPAPVRAPSLRFSGDPRMVFYLLSNAPHHCWSN